MGEVLSVKGLTRTYGDTVALSDASFAVGAGEILGLLGPNGAGKTTSIRIIMDIISADSGEVNFSFKGAPVHSKERIGYLPEERGLYEDAKVLDNLLYFARLKGMEIARAEESAMAWLDKLELADWGQKKLEQLSKGMQQKVQFIASVLHEPDLLVLDEPFSGLDPINQDLFKDIIRELQDRGTAIVLSAHQMGLVEELCDRIFMVNAGRQVLYGDLREIKRKHPENIIDLRFRSEDDASSVESLQGSRILRSEPGHLVLRHHGDASVNELLAWISCRVAVEEISIRKPPLHDIFVEMVKKRGDTIEDPTFA